MEDFSLHILDCAQNSLRAGATHIAIAITERKCENTVHIMIKDNGTGMDNETLQKAQDPFFTTKPDKRIGLGISLFAQSVQESAGTFEVVSVPGRGTTINAYLTYDHIDCKPIGNIADTIVALITSMDDPVDIVYTHAFNDTMFELDTKEIRETLDGVSIKNPSVLMVIKKRMTEALNDIRKV